MAKYITLTSDLLLKMTDNYTWSCNSYSICSRHVWYLIVLIPDLCTLTYNKEGTKNWQDNC